MVLLPVWGVIEEAKYGAGSAIGQFLSGVNSGVKDAVCDLYRRYPNWIQRLNPVNGFYRGFMDAACRLPEGLEPTPRPLPPFTGGQCEGVGYAATGVLSRPVCSTSGCQRWSVGPGGVQVFGPVSVGPVFYEFANAPNDWFAKITVFGGNGQAVITYSAYCYNGQFPISVTVARQDGLADECGDPDPVLPTGPEPSEEDRTFDYDIPITVGPNTVNIPISIGPITPIFAPEFSFAPVFNIPIGEPGDRPQDRLPTTLTPDGLDLDLDEIRRRLQENQDQLQRNNAEILDNKEKLEELLACVCLELDRTIEVQLCDQEAAVELSSTGKGLLGILNFLVLLNSGANIRHAELCSSEDPIPPEQVAPSLIASGTTSFSNRAELVQVGAGVVSVQLRITEYDRKLVPVFSVDDFQGAEGKFGSLSIGLADDVVGGGVFQAVYTTSTIVRLPGHLKNRGVRIGLKPGISWQLYDTGERSNG